MSYERLRFRVVAVLVSVATLAACFSSGGGTPTEAGGGISVAASFYPLAEAAHQVGGDAITITNLTPPGVEPHDLELSPGDVETIQSADLVAYLGGGFQPAVEEAVRGATGDTLDALAGVDTHEAPPAEAQEGLELDPHVWLDPIRYSEIVDEVADALNKVDPDSADQFMSNAADYSDELAALDQVFQSGLASCERNELVTNHAAFGYLAERYGLTQQPISGLEPDAEPTPQHLADLVALVKRDGVTTIFTEELMPPDIAQTLADEAGVDVAVLSTLESAPETGDYLSAMRDNLDTLRQALGCT